jgi:cobalt-zinc-cadmium efflux system membrane fusion protein
VLYTVADLSSVWVDFAVYPQHVGHIRRGQEVRVSSSANGGLQTMGRVDYVGPLLEQDTRMSYARVVLSNPTGDWLPGLYVSVTVTVDRARVAAAVPEEAIVRTADGPAVFRAEGGTFVLQPITTGRTDGMFTEVTQGVLPGDSIVVRNAFLVKAELGKSSAGHDH